MGSQQGKSKTPSILITGLDNAGKSTLIKHLNPRKYKRKLVSRIEEEYSQTQTSASHQQQQASDKTYKSEGSPRNRKSSTRGAPTESTQSQILSSGVSLGMGGGEAGGSIQIETFTKLRLGGDFTVFDLQPHNYRQRDLWELFYQDSSAIVFVIDNSDRLRMQVVKNELDMLLDHPDIKRKGQPILFLANKIDKIQQKFDDEATIVKSLSLETIIDRVWTIRKCSSLTGEGIIDALQWLNQTLKDQRKLKKSQRRNSVVGRAHTAGSGARGRSGSLGRLSTKSYGMKSEPQVTLHSKGDKNLHSESERGGAITQDTNFTLALQANSLTHQYLSDETALSPASSFQKRMEVEGRVTLAEQQQAGRRTLAITSDEKKRAKAALRRSLVQSQGAQSRGGGGINPKLIKSSKIVINSQSQPFVIQEIKIKK